MLYSKEPIYSNKTTIDRRVHYGSQAETIRTTAQIAARKANDSKDFDIDDRILKFQNRLKMNMSIEFPYVTLQV